MADYDKSRLYWIKLTDRFMSSDTVDFLMSQKDGANYVVLYQMLCLKTINNNGVMARTIGEMLVPYDIEKIQRDCKWFTLDTVRVALELYKKLGLIYERSNGVFAITDFDRLIGSQSKGALKKQEQISRRTAPQVLGGQKVENFPPEKDKEKEKDIDYIYIVSFDEQNRRIFQYWNEKKIIQHREIYPAIRNAVKKALGTYTEEQIMCYIDRYATVLEDASYFWHYKWTLKEFLTRKNGIASFTDEGSTWQSYQAHLKRPKPKKNGAQPLACSASFDVAEAIRLNLEHYGSLPAQGDK